MRSTFGLSARHHFSLVLGVVGAWGLAGCGEVWIAPSTSALPPRALLAVPLYAPLGQPVDVDAGASSDRDGTLVSYTFYWGDDSAHTTQATPVATHVFGTPGAFEVSVVVRDDSGQQSRQAALVVVRDEVAPCAVDTDCPENTVCRDSLCYLPGDLTASVTVECADDGDCQGGRICRAGLCLASPPSP